MVSVGSRLSLADVLKKEKKSRSPARRREKMRDSLWSDSAEMVWNRKTATGFTTIPRLLPLVTALITELAPKGDPSRVYVELWSRVFDEGLVTILDESENAYCAGYTGTRATRTWRERMLTLSELGFVRFKPVGNREIGQVLLLDPLGVCHRLHKEQRVPDEWWSMFVKRATEIGAEIPKWPAKRDGALKGAAG